MRLLIAVLAGCFWVEFATVHAADDVTISPGKPDENGFLIHEVKAPDQSSATLIRVLLPTKRDPKQRFPVVYVLPVEAGSENRFGDGLKEVHRLALHDEFAAIFVAPTFSLLPWYADHPTKPEVRQESYFVNVVVPFVEKTYPAKPEANGRLLLGFSKSGWGAFSLILRHPDTFGRAAAWDAPLMMSKIGLYGNAPIFGTQENFEKYQFSKLIDTKSKPFLDDRRLILTGTGNFRDHHTKAHALLTDHKVKHEYRDGPTRKHDWHSGWVREATELLLQPRKK